MDTFSFSSSTPFQRQKMHAVVGACLLSSLLLPLPGLRAAEAPAFFGSDLAMVGTPYSLQLPAGANTEVTWGDGTVERFAGNPATHVYQKPAATKISVKMRQGNGTWTPLPLNPKAEIQQAEPAFLMDGPVVPGTSLPAVLAAPADSFSVECRVFLIFGLPVTVVRWQPGWSRETLHAKPTVPARLSAVLVVPFNRVVKVQSLASKDEGGRMKWRFGRCEIERELRTRKGREAALTRF